MQNLPSIWIDTLTSYDAVVEQIRGCLVILKENAEEANFMDPAVKSRYSQDVMYMKQFFERAEMLARAGRSDGN